MQTKWEYSLETESRRVIHCATQIATGFYSVNHFYALPTVTLPADPNVVLFPNLHYLSIPRFWNRVSKLSVQNLPMDIPQDLLDQTSCLVKEAHLPTPSFQQTQASWNKYQDKIISAIYQQIPKKTDCITNIEIWPTTTGTGVSFNQLIKTPGPITIWLRQDYGLLAIVEAILTSITRPEVYSKLDGVWQESEIIVDWIIAYSPLSALLKKIAPNEIFSPTIVQTRNQQKATLATASNKYLISLGAPQLNIDSIKNTSLQNLAPTEKQLFKLLVDKAPQIVTFDEIGELIFKGNSDRFSLYAITKSIQRLRDKLEQNGISGSFIQTKRGEGYLLTS
jgi:hypothetical protein